VNRESKGRAVVSTDTVLGMVISDPAGTIISADEGAAELLGWPVAELVGLRAIELVPHGDRAAHAEAFARYVAAPTPRMLGGSSRPAVVLRKDGTTRDVCIRLVPLASAVPGAPPSIAAIATEPEHEAAVAAQARREQHLAAAQRITHCGSWELDLGDLGELNRNPLRWSDEAFRVFGYEPGEVEVTNDVFFAAVHPDDREAIGEAVRRSLATNSTYSIEHRVVWRDGSVRIVHERAEIQLDRHGRPVLMIGTVQDITDRKMAEAALRRAEDAAVVADRMASVGLVAAGVAHEINNPLTSVMLSLDLLAGRQAAGRPIDPDFLEDARLGLDRVREIVRDLRVFARDDQDQRYAVDIESVLTSTLRMAGGQIHERALLVTKFAGVPPVMGTEARLGQVFLNLVLNAVHATEPGRPGHNQITVTTSMDGAGRVVATIADTGGGIPVELHPKIFTPFFTTKDIGLGTGLGLSICHRIITSLRGEITFASTVGRGTEFRVVLPPAPAGITPSDSGRVAAARTPVRPAKILVVDDEAAITAHLVEILGSHHDVTAASSAREVLAHMAAGRRFDVILCDLMMPAMTGMALHAELVRVAPDQARRFVPMTAGAFTPEAREFLGEGRRALDKPFDFTKLDAAIAAVLGTDDTERGHGE
jgi:PAS domain S-box-containing protein